MKIWIRITIVGLLAACLVFIRMFEDELFYNVLLDFFKKDHSTQPLPQFSTLKLVGNVTLRYILNSTLSLGILWFLFMDKGIIKISALLYAILFFILLILFLFLINSSSTGQHMTLFYVRRFLIQPLFLLILLPAFYFQHKK
jgi:exosortase F-associated protein